VVQGVILAPDSAACTRRLNSLIQPAFVKQGKGELRMSPDVVRVESNGSLAMANGTIQISHVLQSLGQINMGLRAIAAQGQRRPQVANAFLRFRTKVK